MDKVLEKLGEFGIVPVVVIERQEDAEPLARALCEAGLACAEVTFRTDAAAEAIETMTRVCPEMLVGAGTVLTTAQVNDAMRAGAQFIVSPGFDPKIVDYCIEKNITVVPGCVTPSEVAQGVCRRLEVLKFFPAEQAGGLALIKAIAGPYSGVSFMPTGGISEKNLAEYLECSNVVCCGGSWIAKSELLKAGNFAEVEERAARALDIVRTVRNTQIRKVDLDEKDSNYGRDNASLVYTWA